jgi:hypothetical protein
LISINPVTRDAIKREHDNRAAHNRIVGHFVTDAEQTARVNAAKAAKRKPSKAEAPKVSAPKPAPTVVPVASKPEAAPIPEVCKPPAPDPKAEAIAAFKRGELTRKEALAIVYAKPQPSRQLVRFVGTLPTQNGPTCERTALTEKIKVFDVHEREERIIDNALAGVLPDFDWARVSSKKDPKARIQLLAHYMREDSGKRQAKPVLHPTNGSMFQDRRQDTDPTQETRVAESWAKDGADAVRAALELLGSAKVTEVSCADGYFVTLLYRLDADGPQDARDWCVKRIWSADLESAEEKGQKAMAQGVRISESDPRHPPKCGPGQFLVNHTKEDGTEVVIKFQRVTDFSVDNVLRRKVIREQDKPPVRDASKSPHERTDCVRQRKNYNRYDGWQKCGTDKATFSGG